jgi:hypothetical protein
VIDLSSTKRVLSGAFRCLAPANIGAVVRVVLHAGHLLVFALGDSQT